MFVGDYFLNVIKIFLEDNEGLCHKNENFFDNFTIYAKKKGKHYIIKITCKTCGREYEKTGKKIEKYFNWVFRDGN